MSIKFERNEDGSLTYNNFKEAEHIISESVKEEVNIYIEDNITEAVEARIASRVTKSMASVREHYEEEYKRMEGELVILRATNRTSEERAQTLANSLEETSKELKELRNDITKALIYSDKLNSVVKLLGGLKEVLANELLEKPEEYELLED